MEDRYRNINRIVKTFAYVAISIAAVTIIGEMVSNKKLKIPDDHISWKEGGYTYYMCTKTKETFRKKNGSRVIEEVVQPTKRKVNIKLN